MVSFQNQKLLENAQENSKLTFEGLLISQIEDRQLKRHPEPEIQTIFHPLSSSANRNITSAIVSLAMRRATRGISWMGPTDPAWTWMLQWPWQSSPSWTCLPALPSSGSAHPAGSRMTTWPCSRWCLPVQPAVSHLSTQWAFTLPCGWSA